MDKIEASLGEDGKEFVSKDKSSSVEFRFKTYEMWQNGKQRIAMWFKF
jgi:hypothetical protein